jgi:hypothetical protein
VETEAAAAVVSDFVAGFHGRDARFRLLFQISATTVIQIQGAQPVDTVSAMNGKDAHLRLGPRRSAKAATIGPWSSADSLKNKALYFASSRRIS